jgi:hypothetical protein
MIVALVVTGCVLTFALGSAMRRRDQRPDLGSFDPKSDSYLNMLARIEASQTLSRRREGR